MLYTFKKQIKEREEAKKSPKNKQKNQTPNPQAGSKQKQTGLILYQSGDIVT